MGRKPCCDKEGVKRGLWTIEEDQKLVDFILNNGIQCWRIVPKLAGLMRCGKSCRLRWINYLRPDLKRGALSEAEEEQMIKLHSNLGNRWSKIASNFPGRTDNEIKNIWNTKIKKKLKLQQNSDQICNIENKQQDTLKIQNNTEISKKLEQNIDISTTSSASEENLNVFSLAGESDFDGEFWADAIDCFSSWGSYDCVDDFMSYEIYS